MICPGSAKTAAYPTGFILLPLPERLQHPADKHQRQYEHAGDNRLGLGVVFGGDVERTVSVETVVTIAGVQNLDDVHDRHRRLAIFQAGGQLDRAAGVGRGNDRRAGGHRL